MPQNRPTSIQRIGKALMVGLFIAVPILMFGPGIIVRIQYAKIRPGDTVYEVIGYRQNLGDDSQNGYFEVLETSGGSATLKSQKTGRITIRPIARLVEI